MGSQGARPRGAARARDRGDSQDVPADQAALPHGAGGDRGRRTIRTRGRPVWRHSLLQSGERPEPDHRRPSVPPRGVPTALVVVRRRGPGEDEGSPRPREVPSDGRGHGTGGPQLRIMRPQGGERHRGILPRPSTRVRRSHLRVQGRLARVLGCPGVHADSGGPDCDSGDVTFIGTAKFRNRITMRDYELKRGIAKTLEGDGLRQIGVETFGEAGTQGSHVIVSFGAIEKMIAWTDGKKLFVDTTMKPGAPAGIATAAFRASSMFTPSSAAVRAFTRVSSTFTPAAVRTFFRLSSFTGLPAACRTSAP